MKEPIYVEIAVNVPQALGLFHYHLPEELEGRVSAGSLVEVPFGSQRVQGIVIRPIEVPDVAVTRPVLDLLDPDPVLTLPQLRLAQWMAEQTLSPLAACLDRMLPPGLSQHAETVYRLRAESALRAERAEGVLDERLSPMQEQLLQLLRRRGALRGRQLERAYPQANWRSAMNALIRKAWVEGENILPPPSVQPKLVRTVQLVCPLPVAEEMLAALDRRGSATARRRQAALSYLMREPWSVDVAWVYAQTGAVLADLQDLAERGLVALGESEVWRDPLAEVEFVPDHPPALTHDQERVWRTLQIAIQDLAETVASPSGPGGAYFLLNGVTGSGKTEIYMHAVAETLRLGKQAVILVPEIALTPQTVRRFLARFPGQVGLVHSRLTEGERYDTWRRARAGLLPVIVGPRSALFAPLPKLGLIVVDECHDESYYQSEVQPGYHAAQVARVYARLAGAVCLLGSATPDVVTSFQAEAGRWTRLSLPVRVLAHRQAVALQAERLGIQPALAGVEGEAASLELPKVNLVDMRLELKAGNRSIFSRALERALQQVLDAGQQAILFLNRRGTATYIFCRDCGESLACPECDLPLTLHMHSEEAARTRSILVCHYCGYHRSLPTQCPTCGSRQIRHFGTGTERVETEVQRLFPEARTLRWDAETTRQKGAHEIILAHFASHRADILVGTQMLAKGLDLPFVTLVGIVLADVGLNLPDYRANERTFQTLTQVAGRAGRSLLGGRVVLQTFQPEHYVIQAAANHDYATFYRQEIAYRRKLSYPPFFRMVRLEYRHADPERAERTAFEMAGLLKTWLEAGNRQATDMVGPVPCFFSRIHGLYRWQIVLKGPDPASILRQRPLGEWRVEVDPPNLL